MRVATQIKANAQEAIEDLNQLKADASNEGVQVAVAGAIENMKEIVRLATRIDARTGTIDPSLKAKG